MPESIREKLFKCSDEKYRAFSAGLIPGADNIIGVRLPAIRGMAKDILKGDWRQYLADAPLEYYEEIMLKGIVISSAKTETEERLKYLEEFIPLIDNWGVCDSVCAGIKVTAKNGGQIWDFLAGYIVSDKEFEVRFAAVMMLMHYVDKNYIDRVFDKLDEIGHPGYYARMAVAWAVSVCFAKFPEETEEYLGRCSLDDFTFNKALQKTIESRRIDPGKKDELRKRKRRTKI